MNVIGEIFAHLVFLSPFFLAIWGARTGFEEFSLLELIGGSFIFYFGLLFLWFREVRRGASSPMPYLVRVFLELLAGGAER